MSDKSQNKKIRVRLAPSPTGFFHIGTARTALFNWLFARHYGGKFILRIEDTDLERSKPEFEKDIVHGLRWLGLKWDEFHRQSRRLKIYKKYLRRLLKEKKAFWCYHTEEELEAEKGEQMKKREAPRHVCSHKFEPPINGEKQIIRLAVDENSTRLIRFSDLIRGVIEFEQKVIGDLSLAKDENTPLYNFAVVVDDYEMKISHVIRGEDHIANTPKQILIAEALGIESPQFAHLPLILGKDRSKLSKRHGAVSLREYKEWGYLPEALVNFLSLLGWSPADTLINPAGSMVEKNQTEPEIFSRKEIVEKFGLERVHRAGAVFDPQKLNWLNSRYLRKLNNRQFLRLLEPFVKKHFGRYDRRLTGRALPVFQERLEYFNQIRGFKYLFAPPVYPAELLVWKKSDKQKTLRSLELTLKTIGSRTEWEVFDPEYIRSELDKLAETYFAGDRGEVYWPLRVALSGEQFSPDPVVLMSILGREKFLERIIEGLKKIIEP